MAQEHTSDFGHGTLASYLTGFILAVILTVIPFFLVMNPVLSAGATLATILALAVVQIWVHLVFFLHIGVRPGQGLATGSFLFTAFVTLFLILGSVWIMWNMHHNMMVH